MVSVEQSFDELVDEAENAPIAGWDFGWLEGRATEERPYWHYSGLVARRAATVSSMLDIQSGGGEMLSELPVLPRLTVATEGWMPNVEIAGRNLGRRGAFVVVAGHASPSLPFGESKFDLVTSRHPVVTWWDEIARVLRPGGTFLSQQVGPYSMRELTEALMGPLPKTPSPRSPELAKKNAEAAGLVVRDLVEARLRATFDDIGAIVYFLRLVLWTVPDFTAERYRGALLALHERIQDNGPFEAHSTRFLIGP